MIFSENISFGHQISMDMDLAIIEEKESSKSKSISNSQSQGQNPIKSGGSQSNKALLESNLMGGSIGESCY